MKIESLEILSQCSWCNALRINGSWLKQEENPKLYQEFMKRYEGRITGGICPECLGKEKTKAKEIEGYNLQ